MATQTILPLIQRWIEMFGKRCLTLANVLAEVISKWWMLNWTLLLLVGYNPYQAVHSLDVNFNRTRAEFATWNLNYGPGVNIVEGNCIRGFGPGKQTT